MHYDRRIGMLLDNGDNTGRGLWNPHRRIDFCGGGPLSFGRLLEQHSLDILRNI